MNLRLNGVARDPWLVENFDTGSGELREDIIDLASVRIVIGKKIVDLVEEDVALVYPGRNELLQTLHHHQCRAQSGVSMRAGCSSFIAANCRHLSPRLLVSLPSIMRPPTA